MARYIRSIPVALVYTDRMPLNRSTLKLVIHLATGGTVPPIHVKRDWWGGYKVLDGRHRLCAYKLLGRSMILARYGVRNEVPR